MGRYNKATAAAISQAIVQFVAALIPFDADLEQAIGVVLTAALVWLIPNREPQAPSSETLPAPVLGTTTAFLSPLAMIAAVALAVTVAGCNTLLTGDQVADHVLGRDCGPESRAFRARMIGDSLVRNYPDITADQIYVGVEAMENAANAGSPIEPSALEFQAAVAQAMAPYVVSGYPGEPFWLGLTRLPALGMEFVTIRQAMASYCAEASA
jgi:hypothetical protein